jgi:hypothetical protein
MLSRLKCLHIHNCYKVVDFTGLPCLKELQSSVLKFATGKEILNHITTFGFDFISGLGIPDEDFFISGWFVEALKEMTSLTVSFSASFNHFPSFA